METRVNHIKGSGMWTVYNTAFLISFYLVCLDFTEALCE